MAHRSARSVLTVLHQERSADCITFHECRYQRPHGVRGLGDVLVIVATG